MQQRNNRKITVNLALDDKIVEEIKREAKHNGMSLNARINSILSKYINFYKRSEEVDDTCIVPKKYFQFIVDNLDEKDHIAQVTEMHRIWVPAFFNDLNIPFTLENFVKYAAEGIGVNSRVIDSVRHQKDEEGTDILSFTHRFGIKWSKALGLGLAAALEELLTCRTKTTVYPGNFVIKIIKSGH